MEKSNEKQTKPTSPNVRNKHGTVIIAGLRKVIKVTFGAALQHIKRPNKRPTVCFKNLPFLTSRTFKIKNTITLTPLFDDAHGVLKYVKKGNYSGAARSGKKQVFWARQRADWLRMFNYANLKLDAPNRPFSQ